jgi:hypothetical protein
MTMNSKEAVAYRDLDVDEIIALAETRVFLITYGERAWSWIEKGRAYEVAGEVLPRFPTKLAADDDAVCELGLDG